MIETEASGQKIYSEPRPAIGYGNFSASDEPTEIDDEPHGYSVNSMWFKTSAPKRLWINVDNTEGAAVWQEIPLTGFRMTGPVFDSYEDYTTTGTAAQTLHSGTVHRFLFFENGDEVRVTYRGTFEANTNTKLFQVYVDGNSIFDTGSLTKNGGAWRIEIHMMRTDTDALGISAFYEDETSTVSTYTTQGSMDFNDAFEVHINGATPDAAGDLTLHTLKAFFIPKAAEGSPYGEGAYLASEEWALLTSETGDQLLAE